MNRHNISTAQGLGGRGLMETPEDVERIMYLHSAGWGRRRIGAEMGISPNTVRRYVRQGGWKPYTAPKREKMAPYIEWAEESLRTHKGNAAVVRQELEKVHKVTVSLRSVQRAVAAGRCRLAIETLATVRYETPPGKQMQIDFGSLTANIGGELKKIYLFVATLGYSRRQYVKAFLHERQSAWFEGIEGAFEHFGGVPEQVLMDNARALVNTHNRLTREVSFNPRLVAFANYWGFTPKACAPYRARTKGKDEAGVKYVKRNGIAGRTFMSWAVLEGHLSQWLRETSDTRIHGTTGEQPIERFSKGEMAMLKPLKGRLPYEFGRELERRVQTDSCVEIDTNFYSVPWALIRREVTVQVSDTEVRIFCDDTEVARHSRSPGRRQRVIASGHLTGILGTHDHSRKAEEGSPKDSLMESSMLRPLSEYEEAAGGGW
ncbi:MAG: IS21 family transposase [Chlamydiia bacterium]